MRKLVTIGGEPGCGKTSVAKLVAEKIGAKYFSTGLIQRAIAASRGISTLELNIASETDSTIDELIDSRTRELVTLGGDSIVDSRLAWHFLPRALKIFLICPLEVAASRVSAQNRSHELYQSTTDAISALSARYKSESLRFQSTYGATLGTLRNYDLVVDSTFMDPNQIAEIIVKCIHQPSPDGLYPQLIISPQSLLPTSDVRSVAQDSLLQIRQRYGEKDIVNAHIPPTSVCRALDSWFIFDGHKRVAASIDLGAQFVRANLIAQDDEVIRQGMTARSFACKETSMSKIYDWEAAFDFRFMHYPSLPETGH